jgi:hypothetical protein
MGALTGWALSELAQSARAWFICLAVPPWLRRSLDRQLQWSAHLGAARSCCSALEHRGRPGERAADQGAVDRQRERPWLRQPEAGSRSSVARVTLSAGRPVPAGR